MGAIRHDDTELLRGDASTLLASKPCAGFVYIRCVLDKEFDSSPAAAACTSGFTRCGDEDATTGEKAVGGERLGGASLLREEALRGESCFTICCATPATGCGRNKVLPEPESLSEPPPSEEQLVGDSINVLDRLHAIRSDAEDEGPLRKRACPDLPKRVTTFLKSEMVAPATDEQASAWGLCCWERRCTRRCRLSRPAKAASCTPISRSIFAKLW